MKECILSPVETALNTVA